MSMNRLLTAVRALATAGLLAAPLAHAVVPDPSFGLSGKATVNFDLGGNNSDRAVRLLRLADGRYIVVGEAQSAAGLRVAIARLNSDGTLDTTFDGDGRLTVDACMNQVVDAALDGLGRILVLGNTIDCAAAGVRDGRLLRLNPNGTLDGTFAGGGQTSLRFSTVTAADDLAGALVLRSNGEILVGGGALSVDGRSDAVLRLNESGGLIARLNGQAIGGADLRVVAGLAISDGGALWLVRRTGASLALGSAYFWRLDANLANFSGYGTGGHKGIVSGGPEIGCGTQFEHIPTAVVTTPGRFRAFGHALVNGVARSWYASVDDAAGGTGLRIRCLTGSIGQDVYVLAAAPGVSVSDGNLQLGAICGAFNACLLRARVLATDPEFIEIDPRFNGGQPLIASFPAAPGQTPAGGAVSAMRQNASGQTVIAGWRRWNTAGDDDFALARFRDEGLHANGFESP